MTPRDLCVRALKRSGALGVGQTPLAEDINDAFATLNDMVGQWAQKRWLVYHLVDLAFVGTGNSGYTIGPGGFVNVSRPDRIESAFVRLITPGVGVDYPLEVIEAREDWNSIALKGQAGFPTAIFYDSDYPTGTLYVTPVPSSQYQIHLSVKQPITAFTNLSSQVNLPPEYNEALLYNLAVRLYADYGLPPRADVVALAKAALQTIRNSNTQIATLRMPAGMPGVWRYGFGVGGLFSVGTGVATGGTGTGSGSGGDTGTPTGAMPLGQGSILNINTFLTGTDATPGPILLGSTFTLGQSQVV